MGLIRGRVGRHLSPEGFLVVGIYFWWSIFGYCLNLC